MIQGFKHYMDVTVRFNEVDMLGVCNNAVYVSYFEEARIKYLKYLGLIPKAGIFSDGDLFFMVRNEINYRSHSYYDDELRIFSRVSYIKKSSFAFDHVVLRTKDAEQIADGSGVVVRVNPNTRKSIPLSTEFISAIKAFEPNMRIIESI